MTYAGARGQTAKQMAHVLNFPRSGNDVHVLFSQLGSALHAEQTNGGIQLEIANSLWPQNRYPFRQEFTELLRAKYRASITPLDYDRQPEQARATINQWVDERTHHKISDAMPRGAIDNLTRLALVDVVYFKGLWETPFPESATRVSDFYVAPAKPVKVPFMWMEEKLQYWETKDLQGLVLPYKGGAFEMVILLPRGGGLMETDFRRLLPAEDNKSAKMFSIDELERNLTPKNLSAWTGSTRKEKVHVWLPKFSLSSRISLSSTLQALGIKDAFSVHRANFSGMDGKPGSLYLSSVLHQATIEVNEKGSEATASTEGVGTKSDPASFLADHPFVFLVRHSGTGCILFMGRVAAF